ncbi:putative short-chain dehydrogenase reductase protein [Rosellinia necatrix]|uniref:Putative short-chain dehydrogenase reductase protein n=1 Tax=Rosellinia necatrix TaxID=77044 RepID=A0A1W2TCH7_ROSNE|nr:putative short-chain dehydrogenase reductase protein [Rosellinia necatrix]
MSAIAKTIVATGATSGIGFEAIKQLLLQSQPYHYILGARDVKTTTEAYNGLQYDSAKHTITILPLELNNMKAVKAFAQQTLEKLGSSPVDYLMLNAATGMTKKVSATGPHGSKWIEPYLVNHLSQHYLLHLLRPKLEESKARIVVVSSGAVRMVTDTSTLEDEMLAAKETSGTVYPATKFIQFAGAHWWRRQLAGRCDVVAVSPGLIPNTGLGRGSDMVIPDGLPDAKSVPEGARSVLAAFARDDFPEDPDRLFLTSWGEWWPKDLYPLSLDRDLQDRWSPSREAIEREEGVHVA